MVEEVDDLFRCEECGLRYEDEATARKCEKFCSENNACNPEIIAESVDT